MTEQLTADLTLDGYRLIRFLGRGGFGEVWLCRSEAMGDYRALKWIPATHSDRLEKEYESLLHYRKAAAGLRSPHLVAIEHVNRNAEGLYYVMPLADGYAAKDPSDPEWQPLCLAAKIRARAAEPRWFSSGEIIALMQPILNGLQTLSDAGLVHRDAKPENIVFFNGTPCLGDISLLGEDAAMITRRGTPGYATPSWYVGGHPDMYGAAVTLYTLLTGNPPDRMGKSTFLLPPKGEHPLTASERAEWKRLHAVIRRATDEKVSERYVDFSAMSASLSRGGGGSDRRYLESRSKKPYPAIVITATCVAAVMAGLLWYRMVPETPTNEHGPATTKNGVVSPSGESLLVDAAIAYNSLTSLGASVNSMSFEESKLFQGALPRLQHSIYRKPPDFRHAVSLLDQCIDLIPKLEKMPNLMLARLLLLRSAGEVAEVKSKMDDPSFLVLGDDNLDYRVELLGRLDADKAEEFLEAFLESTANGTSAKSAALLARTRLRAKNHKYAEALADTGMALALAKNDPVLKASVTMKISGIEGEFPGYAAYLKTRPEK